MAASGGAGRFAHGVGQPGPQRLPVGSRSDEGPVFGVGELPEGHGSPCGGQPVGVCADFISDWIERADRDDRRCDAAEILDLQGGQVSFRAAGVITDSSIDLIGRIGRAVLDNLLPDRRMRINARTVARAISKYNARGPIIDRATYKATIAINVLTPTNSTPAEDP